MESPASARGRFLYLVWSLAALGVLIPFIVYIGRQQYAFVQAPELMGRWYATLTLDRALGDHSAPASRVIDGSIQLWPDSLGENGPFRAPYVGHSELDLGPFGFGRGWQFSTSHFPAPGVSDPSRFIVAKLGVDDTLEVIVNPFVSHGYLELRVAQTGDSLTGRWTFRSDVPAALGRVVLRRRSGSISDRLRHN
jgi:hypothetical protein